MSKYIYYFVFLLILSYQLTAQKEYNDWYFGDKAGITFNTPDGEPEILPGNKLNYGENYSVISDSSGELLMYSAHDELFDAEGNLIDAGFNIDGHFSSSQGSVLLHVEEGKYMRIGANCVNFEVDNSNYENNLSYVLITKENGRYTANTKTVILEEYLGEGLLIIKDFCSNSFYLVVNDRKRAEYRLFKYDIENDEFIQKYRLSSKFLPPTTGTQSHVLGYLKSTINGKYIASCHYLHGIEFLKFNRDEEEIEYLSHYNPGFKDNKYHFYSGEFSPNSKHFYFFGRPRGIYMFSDISMIEERSLKLTALISGINTSVDQDFYKINMQLGPNGKIYISNNNKEYLSVIANPNDPDNPEYLERGLYIAPGSNKIGLPNIPITYYLDNDITISKDTTVCEGSDVKLNLEGCLNDPEFHWTGPNSFTSDEKNPLLENLKVEDEGIYKVEITDEGRSIERETFITVNPKPNPTIIVENGYEPCSKILAVEEEYESYEWNTNETTKSITVFEGGEYEVKVTNSYGCEAVAKVDVESENDISFEILGPEKICFGEEAVLECDKEFDEYLWSTEETSESITVSEAGIYELTVTTDNGCKVTRSFELENYPRVQVEFEKPITQSICKGDSVILESKFSPPYYKFQWNTGETDKIKEVTESGTYKLIITDTRYGCKDSAEIGIDAEKELEANIIGDENICEGESTILKADPTNPDFSYEWNTKESGSQIEVSEPGVYTVTVSTDRCSGEAEFEVNKHPLPEFTIVGEDDVICVGETTKLMASKEYEQYSWSNGGDERAIEVGGGYYSLTVTDSNGCSNTDNFTVEENSVSLAFESLSYNFGEVYVSENRDTTIKINNNSGEDVTAIIDGEIAIIPEDGYEFTYSLDNSSTGEKRDFINIEVTEPCKANYQIEITAEVYARVFLSTIERHTEIGETETIPYYIEADSDLGEKEFKITTNIDKYLFFTNDSYEIPSPQIIEQGKTKIHEQTGTILLAENHDYQISFQKVEFDDPFIRWDTLSGKISFDEICIHDNRLIQVHDPTEISIAPNPASDVINLNISTGEAGRFKLELVSTEGRTAYFDSWDQRSNSKNIQIDTRDLTNGVYQLRLITEGHIYSKEVIVVD